jgi:UDP-N-acetylglucosamine--dolichyl-phosphate N-acetylglucosaminephosphotransferase
MGALTLLSYLAVSAVAAFLATYLFLPWLIKSLRGTSAVGKDLNKLNKPLIPEMGGLGVVLGFYIGVTLLVVVSTPQDAPSRPYFFAALLASLGAGVVGLIDDMFGLRKRTKALLPFVLALPLGGAVFAGGDSYILGLNIGILMVFAVAIGVTSAANAANMLEGLNGLGAGLMIIMTTALIVISYTVGSSEGVFLLFPLLGSLVAFLWYNRYPARVFPGDSMTLFAGATIASAAIVSSPAMKTVGAVLFLPMIVEFFLKSRGKFRAENYGQPDSEGRLHHQGRIESLTHAVMRRRPMKEWHVVAVLWCLEAAVGAGVVLAVILWR